MYGSVRNRWPSYAKMGKDTKFRAPTNDFPVLNRDDRNEPVVVGRTARENLPVHFVFKGIVRGQPGKLQKSRIRLSASLSPFSSRTIARKCLTRVQE